LIRQDRLSSPGDSNRRASVALPPRRRAAPERRGSSAPDCNVTVTGLQRYSRVRGGAPLLGAPSPPCGPLEEILELEISRYLGQDQTIGFSAALAVGDERAFHVRGLANRQTGWPVRSDTLFLIGSVQKVFTATLAAGRILEGRMSFTEQVTRYLPPEVGAQGSVIIGPVPAAK
jgi:CubicO group peptidase (beta-lactamase class C family)